MAGVVHRMAAEPSVKDDRGHVVSLDPGEDDEDTSIEIDEDVEVLAPTQASDTQHPPKRKGGRKPVSGHPAVLAIAGKLTSFQIYATVEERKQRNRQAQAAFRERRTEYIKQLENTLKQHEELLQVAQRERQITAYQSASMQSRVAALERILRENGAEGHEIMDREMLTMR